MRFISLILKALREVATSMQEVEAAGLVGRITCARLLMKKEQRVGYIAGGTISLMILFSNEISLTQYLPRWIR